MGSGRPNPLLEVRELKRLHVGPISLRLFPGQCLCITGPSGSGKTLFLRAIADLDPSEGEVLLEGVPRERFRPSEWRTLVGMLPSEVLWWRPKVREHFRRKPERWWFEALALPFVSLDWEVERLSSGEKQRLGLLRLLANRPRVLLLDEPTANLDQVNTLRVERLVLDYLEKGNAALWVTHDGGQIGRMGGPVLRISGRID